jgi:hypothetical protein
MFTALLDALSKGEPSRRIESPKKTTQRAGVGESRGAGEIGQADCDQRAAFGPRVWTLYSTLG